MRSSKEEFIDLKKFELKLNREQKQIQKQTEVLEQLNKQILLNKQTADLMGKKLVEYKEAEENYTLLKDLSDTANGEQKGKTKFLLNDLYSRCILIGFFLLRISDWLS
jgi:hypothetical protein